MLRAPKLQYLTLSVSGITERKALESGYSRLLRNQKDLSLSLMNEKDNSKNAPALQTCIPEP